MTYVPDDFAAPLVRHRDDESQASKGARQGEYLLNGRIRVRNIGGKIETDMEKS